MGCGVIMTVIQAKDQIKIQQDIKQRNSNSSQLSSQHLIKRISKSNQHIANVKATEDKENVGDRKMQKKNMRNPNNIKQQQILKLPEIKQQNYNQAVQEVDKDIPKTEKQKESNKILQNNISNNLTTFKPQQYTIRQQTPLNSKSTRANNNKQASLNKPSSPSTPSSIKIPPILNQVVTPLKPAQEELQKSNGSMTGKNTLCDLPTGRNNTKRESIKVEAMKKMSQKAKNEMSSKKIFRNQISKKSIKVKTLVPVDSLFLQSIITSEKPDELQSGISSQIKSKRSNVTKTIQDAGQIPLKKNTIEQTKSPVTARGVTKRKQTSQSNRLELKTQSNLKKSDKKQQSAIKQPQNKKNNQKIKKIAERKTEQARIFAQTKKKLYQEQKKKLQNESNKLKKVYLLQ